MCAREDKKNLYALRIVAAMLLAFCVLFLGGCGGSGGETTSGDPFEPSSAEATFDAGALTGSADAGFDLSHLSEGYVGATGISSSRLKAQVSCNGQSYNYDLPADGSPIICPLNMGDGAYTFSILQNTTADRYVSLFSTSADVSMADEFQPFIRPNFFCTYTVESDCAVLAAQLTASAANEGDALAAVYNYVVENISYDNDKAARLASATGYVPNPDETLASGAGICFDYASLTAAMLRSIGIPCKIVTGYVGPDDLYHAWNMVYIDGTWQCYEIEVNARTWTRIDPTFAVAQSSSAATGDGSDYADRYIY